MIDSITLWLNNPIIFGTNKLIIVDFLDEKYPLFITEKGVQIMGQKAYFNDDFLNIDIRHDKYNNSSHVYVKFSIPKLLRYKTKKYLTKKDFAKLLKIIKNKLLKIGIKSDLYLAKICRIDFYVDIRSKFQYEIYKPIFDNIQVSRRNTYNEWASSTLYKSNKKELMIYDKNAEINAKLKSKTNFKYNLIRIETRYKSIQIIKDSFNISTVENLIENCWTAYNFAMNEVHTGLFRRKVKAKRILFPDLSKTFESYKNMNKRNWLQNLLNDIAYRSILSEYSLESIRRLLENVTADRIKVHRFMKELNLFQFQNQLSIRNNLFISNFDLYEEIRTKFEKAINMKLNE